MAWVGCRRGLGGGIGGGGGGVMLVEVSAVSVVLAEVVVWVVVL